MKFTLWFRQPLRPGQRRSWKAIGTADTRYDALLLMQSGSGDYWIGEGHARPTD